MPPRSGSSAGIGLVVAIAAILVAGVALTGVFYVISREAAARRAVDAADLLARDALRAFADATVAERLEGVPVGGDSIMAKTRIRTGGEVTGAAVVLVQRPDETSYLIKSTGRLDTVRGPVMCSVDIAWNPAVAERLDVPAGLRPICNGKVRGSDGRAGRGRPSRES